MKKLDLYIIKKFLGTFSFIVAIFLVVSLVIDIAEKMEDLVAKKPPMIELVFDYYVNFWLFYGNLLSPICVFLAVIFFTSRMTQNTEIIAILAGGISFYRLMMPYLLSAGIIAGVSFYLNAFIVPTATEQRVNFEYKYFRNQRPYDETNIHRKVSSDKEKDEETFVYIYSFNQLIGEGYIFSMERVVSGDIVEKINCDRIFWNDSLQNWTLFDCNQRKMSREKESLRFIRKLDTTFLLSPDDIYIKEQKAESLPLNKLYTYIDLEKERGSDIVDELILEKYERFAYPFAAIILAIIGFSVSTKKRRGGTALQLGIGLVLSFIFVVLIVAGQAMVGDDFPAWFAVWYPNIIFAGLALVLLWLAPK